MTTVIEAIRANLRENSDENTRASAHNYFKEQITVYGVKTATVNKIALDHWQEIQKLEKAEIYALCEELFQSGFTEEAFVAAVWLPKMTDRFELQDLTTFKMWIDRYLDNWAKCDTFCNHTIGEFVEKYPQSVHEIVSWAKSANRWLRRAAAVSLIMPARKGKFLREVFEISKTLLYDKDDLVQKGYGWLLREAGKLHEKEVYTFVIEYRKVMPRTALRYAIEKMPAKLKAEAMRKNA